MDRFRLIPQVFFDLIANYIPGLALLVCLAFALPNQMDAVFRSLSGFSAEQLEALSAGLTVATLVLVVLGPYTLGVLLSWPVHSVEHYFRRTSSPFRVPDEVRICLREHQELPKKGKALFYRLTSAARQRIQSEKEMDSQLLLFEWYDYLRLKHPDAGALAAKLRAEMMMYGGLTLVAAFAALIHAINYWGDLHGNVLVSFALVFVFALVRWREHSWTWQFAVANFYCIAVQGNDAAGVPSGTTTAWK
jgi:hypothetical protein